jgi:hypothetical protein
VAKGFGKAKLIAASGIPPWECRKRPLKQLQGLPDGLQTIWEASSRVDLWRKIHAAQEGLEARVGAQGIPQGQSL